MKTSVTWLDHEDETLIKIYASSESVPSQAHRLPGRTLDAIGKRASVLKLVKVKIAPLVVIRTALEDGVSRTAIELAEVTGIRSKFILELLRRARAEDWFHIEAYVGKHQAMRFVIGPGEDAKRPPKASSCEFTQGERRKLSDREIDELYRLHDPSWPAADLLVVHAVNAMVRIGSQPS